MTRGDDDLWWGFAFSMVMFVVSGILLIAFYDSVNYIFLYFISIIFCIAVLMVGLFTMKIHIKLAEIARKKEFEEEKLAEIARKKEFYETQEKRKAAVEKDRAEQREAGRAKREAECAKSAIREEKRKNAKIMAFRRKNFQSGHTLPTNSQKERAWSGKCYRCNRSSIQSELSFWWRIYPILEVLALCDKCAGKEGLVEEQEIIAEKGSRTIPEDVKDAVWRRDEGKCTVCGSNENLEFDHIIPHSKGGSNTKRNIQLLCEPCNRTKSDKIG